MAVGAGAGLNGYTDRIDGETGNALNTAMRRGDDGMRCLDADEVGAERYGPFGVAEGDTEAAVQGAERCQK